MGWDGMKWTGLGEMVFAITYFTTATNLTLPYSFAFAFVCSIPMENGGGGCRCCFCFLFAALVFFGCERDTWVFFGLIGMVWAGLGCMVFSCYSYTSLMN
jgi:hypothetical protein